MRAGSPVGYGSFAAILPDTSEDAWRKRGKVGVPLLFLETASYSGVQAAFAVQTSYVSATFRTLGLSVSGKKGSRIKGEK